MTCSNPIVNAHTSRLHILVALKFSKIVDTRHMKQERMLKPKRNNKMSRTKCPTYTFSYNIHMEKENQNDRYNDFYL